MQRTDKRYANTREMVFILLLVGFLGCIGAGAYGFWKLTGPGLSQIHPVLPRVIGFLLTAAFFVITLGIMLFLNIILFGRNTLFFNPIRMLLSRYLFPVIVVLGRVFRIPEDMMQCSFIDINNRLVRIKGVSVRPEKLMILLPQCLQNDDCDFRITKDMRSCRRCGRCQIAEIVPLLEQNGIAGWVATGGTLARKHVTDFRPDAIIAVACPRDLSSGIIDCLPIPVYGILNQRPEGPCVNTLVDMDEVRWAIRHLVLPGSLDGKKGVASQPE
ncbi:MAG: DUF116 domain-containing protein [bacterium]